MSALPKAKTAAPKTSLARRFFRSIWFFPVVLLLPLLLLTALKINGSSVGVYHQLLYGNTKADTNLITNQPESIRSDEWLVNTQQIIAQSKNHFREINHNIGNGQDMSIVVDVPYKDWSMVFKPHNLAFFVLPLSYAFAFKWWLMGYLLIISCYFFVLAILPGKRLLAAGISVALFFGAFVQWWYAYTTLNSLYYSLFIAVVVMKLAQQPEWRKKALWAALLAYLLACFALILYPPFQIACALVVLAFLVGYALQNYTSWGKREFIRSLLFAIGACVVSLMIVGAFVLTRLDVVKTTTDTVYPGRRSLQSGKFFPIHFMSPQLDYQFVSEQHTQQYLITDKAGNHTNQSEASNFLLLTPFLVIPSAVLLYNERRRKQQLDWSLLLLNGLFIVFLFQLFMPAFTPFSKLLFLNKVGDERLLIGMGLLNIAVMVLLMRRLSKTKYSFPKVPLLAYCGLIFIIELLLSLHAHSHFPGFIGIKKALLFSIPLPLVTYLLLKKRFELAIVTYLLFSLLISYRVNPLYRGLDIVTKDPLSAAVKDIGAGSNKRWITDGGYIESIASDNGLPSLSGVYSYPQFGLWNHIPGASATTYNRYAHVGFQVDDSLDTPTSLQLFAADGFVVHTSSCSDYLKRHNVGFLVTSSVLSGKCTALQKTISYPLRTLYIYKIQSP